MNVNINGPGHMTKLAAMPLINLIVQNQKTYDFETLSEASVKVCINHDPGMTLTYFMARSAEVAYCISQVSVYRTIGPLVSKN